LINPSERGVRVRESKEDRVSQLNLLTISNFNQMCNTVGSTIQLKKKKRKENKNERD
jgi:hypothetical protein